MPEPGVAVGRHPVRVVPSAGLVEVYVNTDGKQAMRLTDDGARLARQMSMSEDPDAVLDALLEAQSGS